MDQQRLLLAGDLDLVSLFVVVHESDLVPVLVHKRVLGRFIVVNSIYSVDLSIILGHNRVPNKFLIDLLFVVPWAPLFYLQELL